MHQVFHTQLDFIDIDWHFIRRVSWTLIYTIGIVFLVGERGIFHESNASYKKHFWARVKLSRIRSIFHDHWSCRYFLSICICPDSISWVFMMALIVFLTNVFPGADSQLKYDYLMILYQGESFLFSRIMWLLWFFSVGCCDHYSIFVW